MSVRRSLALAAGLMASATMASAAPVTYFGEDLTPGNSAGLVNAFAAEAQFLAQLSSHGTENLETRAADTQVSNLLFSGAGVIGSLSTPTNVLNAPFNQRFAVDGTNYLDTSFNRRIEFSQAVQAFGLFVIDANERDNDPAQVTINGATLTQAQIDARPFDSVDGIFRLITERSPGVFEVLFDGGTFPIANSGMFVGVIDADNPFTNVILINGTSGLDNAFQDGFGYDRLTVGSVQAGNPGQVPEPSVIGLLATSLAALAWASRRRPRGR